MGVAADFDVAEMFRKAKENSEAAVVEMMKEHDLMVLDLVDRTERQVDSLFEDIVGALERTISAAAFMGHRQATVLHFKGSGTYVAHAPTGTAEAGENSSEGLSLLYLLLGPREVAMQGYLAPFNITFLLQKLRTHLFPFAVRHTWHQHDHSNSLTVHW